MAVSGVTPHSHTVVVGGEPDLLAGDARRVEAESVVLYGDRKAAPDHLDQLLDGPRGPPEQVDVLRRTRDRAAPELEHQGTLQHEAVGVL